MSSVYTGILYGLTKEAGFADALPGSISGILGRAAGAGKASSSALGNIQSELLGRAAGAGKASESALRNIQAGLLGSSAGAGKASESALKNIALELSPSAKHVGLGMEGLGGLAQLGIGGGVAAGLGGAGLGLRALLKRRAAAKAASEAQKMSGLDKVKGALGF